MATALLLLAPVKAACGCPSQGLADLVAESAAAGLSRGGLFDGGLLGLQIGSGGLLLKYLQPPKVLLRQRCPVADQMAG